LRKKPTGNEAGSEEDEDELSMVSMDSQSEDSDDEEEDPGVKVSYEDQQEILMCQRITDLREEDWLADVQKISLQKLERC
jgi:hypothetical protein